MNICSVSFKVMEKRLIQRTWQIWSPTLCVRTSINNIQMSRGFSAIAELLFKAWLCEPILRFSAANFSWLYWTKTDHDAVAYAPPLNAFRSNMCRYYLFIYLFSLKRTNHANKHNLPTSMNRTLTNMVWCALAQRWKETHCCRNSRCRLIGLVQ